MADETVANDTPEGNGKRITYLPVEQLRFDPGNPRLPESLDGESQDEVIRWMLRDATLIELMGSIGEEGYFPGEPMLVAPRANENGERPPISEAKVFDVVEGNRRLAAILLLRNPELAPTRKRSVSQTAEEAKQRPDTIPTIQYQGRGEILNYLGYRHITGIQEWSTLSKARYLNSLRPQYSDLPEKEQFRTLAKRIGSRRDYVERLLTGLSVYEEIAENNYYNIPNLDEESIGFTVITTALNYKNIATFLGLSSGRDPELEGLVQEHLEELTRWMFQKNPENQTRLGESRNLDMLSKVVDDEEALEAFREGASLDDAHDLTGAPTDIFQEYIAKALERLKSARDQLHKAEPTDRDSEKLFEIMRLSKTMRSSVEDFILENQGAE